MNIEQTKGYKAAISFKPFIDAKCSEHMEIVKDMAKAINTTFGKELKLLKELSLLGIRSNHSPHRINALIHRATELLK